MKKTKVLLALALATCAVIQAHKMSIGAESKSSATVSKNKEIVVNQHANAMSLADEAPAVVNVWPENNSFNLVANEFRSVQLKYNMSVDPSEASARISRKTNFGTEEIDLTNNLRLTSSNTVSISIPLLADGEWSLVVEDIASEDGVKQDETVVLLYEVGQGDLNAEVRTMYQSDFNGDETDAVPLGWNTYNEAGYHLYGFNSDGSRMKYAYGANPGGGGTRLFDGFSGDFTKALYWGTRGTNEGYASFGELIQDYMDADGNVDESSLPDGVNKEDISLYLTPGKYNVGFKMAAWKNAPQFDFTLEDLDGNVYANFEGYTAKPNLNGAKGKVTGTLALEADFRVETEGYYVLKFVSAKAQWQEFMLADVKVVTMPGKAAYYNNMLRQEAEEAQEVLARAQENLELYKGSSYNSLLNEILYANNAVANRDVNSPSGVQHVINNLRDYAEALEQRMDNLDAFASLIQNINDKIEEYKNTKYASDRVVGKATEYVANYGNINIQNYSDDALADVVDELDTIAAKLSNVQLCSDILTYGINQALQTYNNLGTDDEAARQYAESSITDNRVAAQTINKSNKLQLYKLILDGSVSSCYEEIPARKMINTSNETMVAVVDDDPVYGIDMTGYIVNPNMYRVTDASGMPGWTVSTTNDKGLSIGYGGTTPGDAEYVTNQYISIYGDANYRVEQSISGLPVGIYTVVMATRTPLVDHMDDHGRMFYYNAQNDLTQEWDKYIYATIGGTTIKTPYLGHTSYSGDNNGEYNTVLRNIVVGENGILTIGATESYVSGKAIKHETNVATDFWEGTTMVDDVHVYFTAPLDGYDYAAALSKLEENGKLLELTDATPFVSYFDREYEQVVYTRTFNNTGWQALYVPFSMTSDDWEDDFEVATINMFHQYDDNKDGVFDRMEMEIKPVLSGKLRPNHPYLIKAKTTGTKSIKLSNATVYKTVSNSFECSSMEMRYTFTGTYAGISGSEMLNKGYYSMGGGSLIQADDNTANLNPFRWYLKMEARDGQVIPLPKSVKVFMWDEDDDEDAIRRVESKTEGSVYKLDGIQVSGKLRPGLYIQNGKKIIIQ